MAEFLQYAASAYLWRGMLISIEITAVAMTLALVLGLGLAVMRESSNSLLRVPAVTYVWALLQGPARRLSFPFPGGI